MEEPFWGEGDTVLLPRQRPELAIIHVAQCGDKGTARWRGVGTIDKEISFAADRVVILAEEVVPESEMRKLPEGNQIPYFVVDAIVECPWGAFPSSVPFYYDYDAPFMRDMDKASRNRRRHEEVAWTSGSTHPRAGRTSLSNWAPSGSSTSRLTASPATARG